MTDRTEEAARWFAARHRGVMLQDERAEFAHWSADAANAAALAEFEAVWGELEAVTPDAAARRAAASRRSYRTQVAAMAAFVALSAAILPRIDGVWWNTLDWWSR